MNPLLYWTQYFQLGVHNKLVIECRQFDISLRLVIFVVTLFFVTAYVLISANELV